MLKRFFDPWLIYRVVVYLRMSSDKQNRRSPDQQLAEIQRRLKALGYNWRIVKIYRDDAITGRLLRKRPGYQEMMRDIKSGAVVADLIVVDSIERFGRIDELPTIRKELFERNGVLIVTSDSNFADPNTPQGKALGAFEAMRATEDGRIKAHNVLRGKRDAALLKHWPGGPAPFGLKGRSVMKIENGREKEDYCVLEPDPSTRWIIELLFELAETTAFGSTRLAMLLNANPDIPDKYKPFQPSKIDYWLDHEIYYGELVFPKHSTGIVDDVRVVEPNAEEDILRVPEFCEASISRARWDRVQAIRQARRQRRANARRPRAENDGKLIVPSAPGLALNYLLSGLLFCGVCRSRMVISSTGTYITKDGESRRYVGYYCPGSLCGRCENRTRVPEEWVRRAVVAKLRDRLFPRPA